MSSGKKKVIALTLAAALILIGGGAYYLLGKKEPGTSSVEVTEVNGLPEGASVEVVDSVNEKLFNETPRPALERPLPQGTIPSDVYALMVKHRAEAVAMLKENPALMTQWIGLGAAHKQVGDYEGARIYLTYVVTVNPNNLAAILNLGNLYAYYLKNQVNAETYFGKAIAVDPSYVPAYLELYQAQKGQGKTDAAVVTLQRGIAKNPADTDLPVALAHHYRDAHDIPKAKEAYAVAIAAATKAGNTSLAASLTSEKEAL